jgi:transposase
MSAPLQNIPIVRVENSPVAGGVHRTKASGGAAICYGKDVQEIEELKRQGLSIQQSANSQVTTRKTVREYLLAPDGVPVYGRRKAKPGKLDPFKTYLNNRLQAGVWNACMLMRELRERGYSGSYTILTDWLRPQRQLARVVAVRRFETPPGKQGQVDWGHLGSIEIGRREHKLWGFTLTLGYSRMLMAEAALDQNLARYCECTKKPSAS